MKLLGIIFAASSFLLLLFQSFILLTSDQAHTSADVLVLSSMFSFLSTMFVGLGVAFKQG